MNLNHTAILLLGALLAILPASYAQKLGKIAFVGDSITQGFDSSIYPSSQASYRYQFWKGLVDNRLAYGKDYTFTGSQQGSCHKGKKDVISAITPAYQNQKFPNTHEGHFNWCASYLSGSMPIPAADLQQNRGRGTVKDWLSPFTPSGYTADTVFIMLGTNDLNKGRTADQLLKDIEAIAQAYRKGNARVRIYVMSITPPSAKAGRGMMAKVQQANSELATRAASWSTPDSTVSYLDIGRGMAPLRSGDAPTPGVMNIDNWHPNNQGELIMAGNLLKSLGLKGQSAGMPRRTPDKLSFSLPVRSIKTGGAPGKIFLEPESAASWNLTSSQITLDWKGGAGSTHRPALAGAWNSRSRDLTLDLSIQMEKTEGTIPNRFQVRLGNGKTEGTLLISPDSLSWNGSVLYHMDMTGNLRNIRIACARENRNAGTDAGYYVWVDGQLVGCALPAGKPAGEILDGFRMGAPEANQASRARISKVKFDLKGAFAP